MFKSQDRLERSSELVLTEEESGITECSRIHSERCRKFVSRCTSSFAVQYPQKLNFSCSFAHLGFWIEQQCGFSFCIERLSWLKCGTENVLHVSIDFHTLYSGDIYRKHSPNDQTQNWSRPKQSANVSSVYLTKTHCHNDLGKKKKHFGLAHVVYGGNSRSVSFYENCCPWRGPLDQDPWYLSQKTDDGYKINFQFYRQGSLTVTLRLHSSPMKGGGKSHHVSLQSPILREMFCEGIFLREHTMRFPASWETTWGKDWKFTTAKETGAARIH